MLIVRPLRAAPTALLWAGLSLSAVGDQLYAVALSWIAVGVLGAYAGYLSALQAVVVLLAVLGIGQWADRWDQRRSMVGADLGRAAVLVVVVLAWLAAGRPSALGLVSAVVVLAVGQAVFQPALQAVLPGVVDDAALLPAANGLLDTTDRSARLLGPGLVGLLAGVVPPVHFLSIDAASFLVSAAALAWIGRLRPFLPSGRASVREAAWQAIQRGVRAMRSHKLLGYALSTTALVNGAWYAVFFLALPLAIERHGVEGPGRTGLGAYGLVLSAYGCTNLAATLVLGSRPMPVRPQFQMFGGSVLVGSGIVLMAASLSLPQGWLLPGLAAGAALGAAGGPMKDIPMAVLRQTRLAVGDRAAAMRAYMAANSLGILAGMLVAPGAIGLVGQAAAMAACGVIIGGTGIVGVLRFRGWWETA